MHQHSHRQWSDMEFVTAVAEIRSNGLVLSRTEFVPDSTDRASDTGLIGDLVVEDVVVDGSGTSVHVVGDRGALRRLRIGDRLTARIDPRRRAAMMRLHTAMHLCFCGYMAVHGPARRHHRRVDPTGAILELRAPPCLATEFVAPNVSAIQEWLDLVIHDDLTISSIGSAISGERRYWHVDGIGTIACAGTHPISTAAVGAISLEAELTAAGLVRLEATLADTDPGPDPGPDPDPEPEPARS